MSDEKETVKVEPGPGNFGECLVEGSTEDKKRGRKIKRRAIAISIALQSLGLTALVIAPMLAKPAELSVVSTTPIPPYSAPHTRHVVSEPARPRTAQVCVVCPSMPIAPVTKSFTREDTTLTKDNFIVDLPGDEHGATKGLDFFGSRVQPKRPDETPREVRRIHEPGISPAMLLYRVEPMYPALARQIRKNGKVELRALIATDGTIQSLQVVSGDSLFVQSALDAVKQWRYKPTLLNGQPVEIDTFITVIYTLNQQ
jgi:protein TonB